MRKRMLIACAVLALGACQNVNWEQFMSEDAGWRDKMCACTHKDAKDQRACVERVEKDIDAWGHQLKSELGDESLPTKFAERFKKIEDEMRECKSAAQHAGAEPAKK